MTQRTPAATAWLATLEGGEHAVAVRILSDEQEGFGLAVLAVDVHRLQETLDDMRRPWWRTGAQVMGLFTGGILAAILGSKGLK